MNRELLFRGFQSELNKWVYGDLIHVRGGGAFIFNYKDGFEDRIVVDPSTVGQSTGLKDKNGKKIFEGDIIEIAILSHFRNDEIITKSRCDVIFQNGSFGIMYGHGKRFHGFVAFSYNVTFEVLGDNHDNKDLIK